MINKTINGYTIKHLIGTGGMADVYYAENKLGKKAAVKVLKSELCAIGTIKERFEQEAMIMVDIEHKHIRQAYDLDEVNGLPAIIMEYLEGHTLKQLIDNGKVSDDKTKKYFEQCISALKVTHAKEIVHRDIKPSNIFITQDDEVKILDFGIAKVKESGLSTRTNQMLGTPVYMSPEQIKSPKHVNAKSDVYSLAVTFYHALIGKVPYDSTTDSDFVIQSKIVHENLDLSRVSEQWQGTLWPMLVKDPEQRVGIHEVYIADRGGTIFDHNQHRSPNPPLKKDNDGKFDVIQIYKLIIILGLLSGVIIVFQDFNVLDFLTYIDGIIICIIICLISVFLGVKYSNLLNWRNLAKINILSFVIWYLFLNSDFEYLGIIFLYVGLLVPITALLLKLFKR
jgi:eukaryotic-like serine/threonine-protein kinase